MFFSQKYKMVGRDHTKFLTYDEAHISLYTTFFLI